MYLVERLSEVSIKGLTIRNGLANDAPHKLEVCQVVRVHVGHGVGLESGPVSCSDEEGVVLIEYIPRQDGIPTRPKAAFIGCRMYIQE